MDGKFDKKDGRQFSTHYLKRTLTNGSTIDRDWLLYSPSRKSILCFVCCLFGTPNEPFNSSGFNDWKHTSRAIHSHELSKNHLLNDITYKQRMKHENSIDESFENTDQNEMIYWRKVLLRIVEVIKFLGSRGLAFRGDNQKLGSKQNGNYLGIIELISKFDPFLEEHLSRHGNKGKGWQQLLLIILILILNILTKSVMICRSSVLPIGNHMRRIHFYNCWTCARKNSS